MSIGMPGGQVIDHWMRQRTKSDRSGLTRAHPQLAAPVLEANLACRQSSSKNFPFPSTVLQLLPKIGKSRREIVQCIVSVGCDKLFTGQPCGQASLHAVTPINL